MFCFPLTKSLLPPAGTPSTSDGSRGVAFMGVMYEHVCLWAACGRESLKGLIAVAVRAREHFLYPRPLSHLHCTGNQENTMLGATRCGAPGCTSLRLRAATAHSRDPG